MALSAQLRRPRCPNQLPNTSARRLVVAAAKKRRPVNQGDYSDLAPAPDPRVDDTESKQFAIACAEITSETKCQEISVLHVAPVVSWTSYMLFATVFSRPQLLAALARIERMVEEEWPDRVLQNQPGSSPWECLDYGDLVVHLMTAEQRELYDIESFFAAAEDVVLPWDVELASSRADSRQRTQASANSGAAAARPVWSR
ncbi:hypothetical protein QJQ45_027997 [Haematococcus lacustris]|nr:hypothetical protein QJQ45_027997 [Haematococcus lacustris]